MALVIAALGLGAMMAASSQGLGNVAAANLYMEATRRAQSHLDAIGPAGPVQAGNHSGDDGDGFSWRVTVTPVGVRPPPQGSKSDNLTLYDVAVTVGWRNGATARSVSVQSERLGRLSGS